jgi:hypothetical protein
MLKNRVSGLNKVIWVGSHLIALNKKRRLREPQGKRLCKNTWTETSEETNPVDILLRF